MDRRRFVRALPMLSATAAGMSTVSLTACASVPYLRPVSDGDRVVLRRSDFGDSLDALVESAHRPWPIYVRRSPDGTFSAVSAYCTHRGCLPDPAGDRLICPCHGSEFAFTGELIKGPAEDPLRRFEVTSDSDTVTIWLDRRVGS